MGFKDPRLEHGPVNQDDLKKVAEEPYFKNQREITKRKLEREAHKSPRRRQVDKAARSAVNFTWTIVFFALAVIAVILAWMFIAKGLWGEG